MHFILEGALYVEWWSLVIAINTALPTNSRTGQPVMVRKSNHPMVCNCILGGKLTIAMGLALKMIIIYQQNLFISCARTYLEKACAHRVMCAIQHPTWNVHTSQRGEREGERGGRWEKKRKRDDRTEVTHAHISNLPKGWEKWINSYLSPDLALKQSVDLLVLAFFIESKPLQQNGDGKKTRSMAYYCWVHFTTQTWLQSPTSLSLGWTMVSSKNFTRTKLEILDRRAL